MGSVEEEERARQSRLFAQNGAVQDKLSAQEDALATVQSALERLVARREAVNSELSEAVAKRSTTEVEAQETEASARASKTNAAQYSKQLQEVLSQVRVAEKELADIEPQHQARAAQLANVEAELATVGTKVEALYGKQGRGSQFKTKAERDRFLQTQIDSLAAQIQQKTALLQRTSAEVAAEEARLKGERQHVEQAQQQHRARSDRIDEISGLIRERTQLRNELQEQRKSGWRDLEGLQEKIQEARQELEKGKQQMNRALPRHIAQGLAAVEDIVREKNIRGYYGPLIRNFRLAAEGYRTAVEVAAGNSLFHVVVDTDATAALLINELDRRKAGRLTFLPLNQLRDPKIDYPQDANLAVSLMERAIVFEPQMRLAIKQVHWIMLP